MSELELLLPQDWELAASAGHVKGPLPIRAADRFSELPIQDLSAFRLWRISLGSEHDCQLSLSRTKPGHPAKPLVLAEADTSYLVRERELQIEARYDLKVAFAPISEVVFHVPRTIRVYAVTYGGDANLGWQVKPRGNQQQIVIQLPDPLLGESRPIRIQGLARVQSGRAWKLPQVTCPQASLLRGEVYLTIEAPLELRTYDAQGYRQTAISVKPDQRETLTFSQVAADADFTAYIGTPPFSMSAQVVNQLTTETEEWQMRSEVAWTCQAGSRFVASCEVLPGWEILDVRRVSESALPVISDWRLSKSAKIRRLTIEFLESLTPMQGKRVQILARRLPMSPGQSLSLSCVRPLSCRSVEQFLAASLPKGSVLFDRGLCGHRSQNGRQLSRICAEQRPIASQINPPTAGRQRSFFTPPPIPIPIPNSLCTALSRRLMLGARQGGGDRTNPGSGAGVFHPAAGIAGGSSHLAQGCRRAINGTGSSKPAGQMPGPISPPTAADQDAPEEGPWILRLPMPQIKPFRLTARREIPAKPQTESHVASVAHGPEVSGNGRTEFSRRRRPRCAGNANPRNADGGHGRDRPAAVQTLEIPICPRRLCRWRFPAMPLRPNRSWAG